MKDFFCGGALLLALIGYGCSSSGSLSASVSSEPTLSQEERLYLQAMAEHEKLGLDLAQDAQRQAQDKTVKQLADRLVGDYNSRLRQLEGLGAVAPDGRENPEQEKRSLASAQTGVPGQSPVTSGMLGPGMVPQGRDSYDNRWLRTFRQHNENGVDLAGNMAVKLKNQGLQHWNAEMIRSERAELAEFQALRVL